LNEAIDADDVHDAIRQRRSAFQASLRALARTLVITAIEPASAIRGPG
jgi:hypothetical protein